MSKQIFLEQFSQLAPDEKARLISSLTSDPDKFLADLHENKHPDKILQSRYESFSENTITNYFLPFGIAPNFLINNKLHHIPMVTEESSVVAAAASAAKFWYTKGGFYATVHSMIKQGQVHFLWQGKSRELEKLLETNFQILKEGLKTITHSMDARGGGVLDIKLLHKPEVLDNYYQLEVSFDTRDSMGANFMNSVLELLGKNWKRMIEGEESFEGASRNCEILMAILSNYTPDCIVECKLETEIKSLDHAVPNLNGKKFSRKFIDAIEIASKDTSRAVTHNKGIYNGVDAVVIATGNDFRAVEANGHAYAARNGYYRSLSTVQISDGIFQFSLTIPLALGTVGGITGVHPMAKYSLDILNSPSAEELMQIVAAVGLANNFSAVKSLISGGIQLGHMQLHLSNILVQVKANPEEKEKVRKHFIGKTVSYSAVKEFLEILRNISYGKSI